MTFNLYSVRDVISGQHIMIGYAPTDGAFLRDNLAGLLRIRRIEELEYYKIGTYDDLEGKVVPCDKVLCSFDSYKFPEVNSKALTKEDILKLADTIIKKDKE